VARLYIGALSSCKCDWRAHEVRYLPVTRSLGSCRCSLKVSRIVRSVANGLYTILV
jgi:hypothetical protein